MAHKHSEDEDGMFSHHQAEYNIEKIIRNLLLVQDHYSMDPCSDCLLKHFNLILAYVEEGKTLDGSHKFIKTFEEIVPLINKHLKIVVECSVSNICRVKKPADMQRMIQEVRSLRRSLNQRIYGLEGDITHDILVEKDEDFHESEHRHAGDPKEESEHTLAL